MNILFEDFRVNVGQEGIYKPAVEIESLSEISNCIG
jgi:hypothetical protein